MFTLLIDFLKAFNRLLVGEAPKSPVDDLQNVYTPKVVKPEEEVVITLNTEAEEMISLSTDTISFNHMDLDENVSASTVTVSAATIPFDIDLDGSLDTSTITTTLDETLAKFDKMTKAQLIQYANDNSININKYDRKNVIRDIIKKFTLAH